MPTVAIDFDGVIHAYRRGWHDGTIYDEPADGAFDAIRQLMQRYAVAIYTTRDVQQVQSWLEHRGFDDVWTDLAWEPPFWNRTDGSLLVTNHKPAAIAYIDDRAIAFVSWPQALAALAALAAVTSPPQKQKQEAAPKLDLSWTAGDRSSGVTAILGDQSCRLDANDLDHLITLLRRGRHSVYGPPPPAAAVIEIIEPGQTTDDTPGGSIIVPRDIRINGVPVLADRGIRVHEMEIPAGGSPATVTVTLLARMVIVAAEGDLST